MKNTENYHRTASPITIETEINCRHTEPNLIDFPHGDYGNLLRFYAFNPKDTFAYDTASKKIYHFKDGVWGEMHRAEVCKLALDAMTAYHKQVTALSEDEELRKSHEQYATKATQASAVSSLVKLLTFDRQVDLTGVVPSRSKIPVLNGLYDLQTGTLQKYDPCEFFNYKIDCPYAEGFFKHSRFETFLQEICAGDDELMEYLQRVYGYALTGETCEQLFFILLGSGSNGKTTLNEAIAAVVGKYAQHIPIDTLLSGSSGHTATPFLARAKGARMLFASEGKKAHVLDEAAIKVLTGGSTIPTRTLYGEPFEYAPEFSIFLDTNIVPRIENLDYAMKRRLMVIPFTAKFKKKDREENLLDELKREEEQLAILEWLLEGSCRYYRNRLKGVPKAIKEATKRCLAENSSVAAFLKKCVKFSVESKCTAEELYQAYKNYCNEHCMFPESQTAFGRQLTALGYKRGRGTEVFYKGLSLK